MNLSARILRWMGWRVTVTVPNYRKCIICVAPHTSNWDFIIGKLVYASVNRHAGFLMKQAWFFPPLSWIFRAMGGIPVPPVHGSDLTGEIIKRFNEADSMQLAITPEGTRSRVDNWRTGFLRIAHGANVPICLAVLDFATKTVDVSQTFVATGDIDADMQYIRDFYRNSGAKGKNPENFNP